MVVGGLTLHFPFWNWRRWRHLVSCKKGSRLTVYNEYIIYEFRSITEVKGAKCPDIQHGGWWTDLHKEFLTRCTLSRKGCRTLHETIEGQTLKKGVK